MNPLKSLNNEVHQRDILYAVASFTIGVGVLSTPRLIAENTANFDGWMSILIGSAVAFVGTWIVAALAARFPQQTLADYAGRILTKPLGNMLTLLYAAYFLFITSFQLRYIANIAGKYLFERTPIEFIALFFLFTVIYAVSGSTYAVLRLNLMFFPIIAFIMGVLLFLNIDHVEGRHYLPMFVTSFKDLVLGANGMYLTLIGFEIMLFYVALMKKPRKALHGGLIGMVFPVLSVLFVYFFIIGRLGRAVTVNLLYPTVELAKETEVPGGFFARFESLFFGIWTMAIFTTATMAMNVAGIALRSVFRKMKKNTFVVIFSPFVYLMAMMPTDIVHLNWLSLILTGSGYVFGLFVPFMLLLIAKMRKVKGHAQNNA